MRTDTKRYFAEALRLVRARAAAGGEDVRAVLERLELVDLDLRGMVPPTMWVTPSTSVTLTLTNLAVPADSSLVTVRFPGQGWIVGVTGTVAEGGELRSAIGMSILENGTNNVFTTGSGPAFLSLGNMTGSKLHGVDVLALRRRVDPGTTFQVQFSVLRSVLAAGSQTYTPRVAFAYEPDIGATGNRS